MHHPIRRATLATIVAALLLSACDGGGPTTDATASPVPTSSPTTSPTADPTEEPTSTPAPSPSPTPSASPVAAITTPVVTACPPAEGDGASPLPTADSVPTTSTDTITESPAGWAVTVTTVQVDSSAGDPAVGDAITAALATRADALVAEFDAAVGPPADYPDNAGTPQFEVTFEVTRVDVGVVSVRIGGYGYAGGASTFAINGGMTFSSLTGELLSLDQLGLGGACHPVLGDLVADQLLTEIELFDEAETALRAGDIDFDQWSLQHDSLYVHLDEYEVAPGVAGAPTAGLLLSDVRAATGTPLAPGG